VNEKIIVSTRAGNACPLGDNQSSIQQVRKFQRVPATHALSGEREIFGSAEDLFQRVPATHALSGAKIALAVAVGVFQRVPATHALSGLSAQNGSSQLVSTRAGNACPLGSFRLSDDGSNSFNACRQRMPSREVHRHDQHEAGFSTRAGNACPLGANFRNSLSRRANRRRNSNPWACFAHLIEFSSRFQINHTT
jgi:hypothetical protein